MTTEREIEGDGAAVSAGETPPAELEELRSLDRDQLQSELDQARAELEDNEALRDGFLGQTGVHIGVRLVASTRRRFELREARLKERVALLEGLLKEASGSVPQGD